MLFLWPHPPRLLTLRRPYCSVENLTTVSACLVAPERGGSLARVVAEVVVGAEVESTLPGKQHLSISISNLKPASWTGRP